MAKADPAEPLMTLADFALMGTPELEGDALIFHASESDCRPTEYVQSIIVSQQGNAGNETVVEDVTPLGFKVMHDLEELMGMIREYLLYWIEGQDDNGSSEHRATMFEAQMDFMVRGERYQDFQLEYYEPFLLPHDAELKSLYGISAHELVDGLAKLERALSQGRFEGFAAIGSVLASHPTSMDPSELSDAESAVLRDALFESTQVGHYDVERITGWPIELIRRMAYSPGEAHWYDQSEYEFWPIVTLPIHDRPFIALDGHYYCFDYYSLMDNFYRVVQKTVIGDDPAYENRWNTIQQEASETLVERVFSALLPGCTCYRNNHYGPRKKRSENDLLVTYADAAIVVEVKAGQFTAAPPLTDYEAHIKRYRALIEDACSQAGAMVGYLGNNPKGAPLFDAKNNEKARISIDGMAEVFAVAVTAENVNTFAAKADKLAFLELPEGTISISIDELTVYMHFFDSPLVFLHFLRQRTRAARNEKLMLFDELDHLGMYIQHNCYAMEADDIPDGALLIADGYRADIDRYFSLRRYGTLNAAKPRIRIPKLVKDIISYLEESGEPNKVDASFFLLDLSDEGKADFVGAVNRIMEHQSKTHRQTSVSLGGQGGDVFATVFVRQRGVLQPYDIDEMRERAASLLFALNEPEHVLITMEFDETRRLADFHFERLSPQNYTSAEVERLSALGSDFLQSRVDSHMRTYGKIGRNEPCPCGSGRKYKKCHGGNSRL